MSYYFVIVSPTDKPLFDLTFGTSKAGGDGVARFRNGETSRYMNQFIAHASLDIVEEVQWLNSNMSGTSDIFPNNTNVILVGT
jgi:trafficking protein particle complex subunit 2